MDQIAVARVSWTTVGKFELDHDQHTARLIAVGHAESSGYLGVHAEIEPYGEWVSDMRSLAGRPLRLMGFPFNTKVVYTIISSDPRLS